MKLWNRPNRWFTRFFPVLIPVHAQSGFQIQPSRKLVQFTVEPVGLTGPVFTTLV
jgi:hypothetical protein